MLKYYYRDKIKQNAKDVYRTVENPEKLVILTIYGKVTIYGEVTICGEVTISTNYDSHYTIFYTSQLLLSSKPKYPPEFLNLKHSSLRTSDKFSHPNRIAGIITFPRHIKQRRELWLRHQCMFLIPRISDWTQEFWTE